MRQRESRSPAAVPGLRLLLPVLLALGLLQMHSFGHVGHDEGGASWPMAAGHMDGPIPLDPPPPPPVPEPDGVMDLLAMCLAIIASLGLAGALIGLLVARTGGRGGGGGLPARRFAARGPPVAASPSIGYRVARLSVLRI